MSPSSPDLEARQRKHVLYTWTAQKAASPVSITHGEGAVFWDEAGARWLDFESQVFNCNAGHGEARIVEAMVAQTRALACAHPAAVHEAKAALGEALASVTPEGLDRFFLCLSGAEAIENAIKVARLVTGRRKVIARRRSYHGASMGALSLTGDPRRHAVEPGLWGVLRAEDPYCYRCPFGLSHPDCGLRCATHLEHIIQMEGPDTIAAVFLEGVTGANGGFVPPDGYWQMAREICDRYGVLLVADEVFTGFGRTGRWFAVDHWGVRPDLMAMAKGLTSGYAPLGALAMTEAVASHFDDETLWCGLTGYAHPVSCAAATAAIGVYRDDDLIARAATTGRRLAERLAAMAARFDRVGDARSLGLFGTLEMISDPETREPLEALGQRAPVARLRVALRQRRVHLLVRYSCVFICPPLCITEDELDEGLNHIESALEEVLG